MKIIKLLMDDVQFMFYHLAMTLGMWKWWNYVVVVVTIFRCGLLCEEMGFWSESCNRW